MNKFCIRDSEDPNQLASREWANQGLFCLPLCHEIGIVYTNWRSIYSFSIGKEPIFGPASGLRSSNIVIIGQLRLNLNSLQQKFSLMTKYLGTNSAVVKRVDCNDKTLKHLFAKTWPDVKTYDKILKQF